MPYPLLRADERPREASATGTPGLRVACLASGRVWFFPGGTPELGMILARRALYDGTLEHPRTEITFGEKRGTGWVPSQVLKAVPVEGGS